MVVIKKNNTRLSNDDIILEAENPTLKISLVERNSSRSNKSTTVAVVVTTEGPESPTTIY